MASGKDPKIRNFDTKPTCHRKFCGECGCRMYLHVDAFPDFELVHLPTLDRGVDAGGEPDRWVFTDSKHPWWRSPTTACSGIRAGRALQHLPAA